jgi:PAS domain S-box-containing protein
MKTYSNTASLPLTHWVNHALVSKTDLLGRITYANEAFVHVSGYPKETLMGQPHRLVRHPDTPKAVFAELWSRLKAGRPWTGVIQNRRADGGFYWVRAVVVPIWQGGRALGYMSVRTLACDDTIARARQGLPTREVMPPEAVMRHVHDRLLEFQEGVLSGPVGWPNEEGVLTEMAEALCAVQMHLRVVVDEIKEGVQGLSEEEHRLSMAIWDLKENAVAQAEAVAQGMDILALMRRAVGYCESDNPEVRRNGQALLRQALGDMEDKMKAWFDPIAAFHADTQKAHAVALEVSEKGGVLRESAAFFENKVKERH